MPTAAGALDEVMTQEASGIIGFKKVINARVLGYIASTTTTPPPGAGQIRWNNATQANATKLYIHKTSNDDSEDLSDFLAAILKVGSFIHIQKKKSKSQLQFWNIQSFTDQTTYYDITVQLESQKGSDFSDTDDLDLIIEEGTSTSTANEEIAAAQTLPVKPVANSIFRLNADTAAFDVILPEVSKETGKIITLIKTDATDNIVGIDGNGTEKINGRDSERLVAQYDTMSLFANGVEWYRLSISLNNKTLVTDKAVGGVQAIPTGTPTIVSWDTPIVDSIDGWSAGSNGWSPGNGVFQFEVSLEFLNVTINSWVELTLLRAGTPIRSERSFSPANGSDVTVRFNPVDSNTDPAPGIYTIQVEHNNGSNLDISSNTLKTFFNAVRIG
jgi:hypothetical protein